MALGLGDEAVADPGFVADVLGLGAGFDLFAELGDEDAEVLGLVFAGGSPDSLEEVFVGEDAAGVAREEDEEIEFLGGEVEVLAGAADDVGFDVDVEVCVVADVSW